jgi:hypothetical protein
VASRALADVRVDCPHFHPRRSRREDLRVT